MKTKSDDIAYCGVSHRKILRAAPKLSRQNIYHLYRFITDRYTVHLNKDVKGLPAPWTNNPVIQEYRFTNVRREHDKQTRYLIKNIVQHKRADIRSKIVNIFLFRAWNNFETFQFFDLPKPAHKLYEPEYLEIARARYLKYLEKYPKQAKKRMWWSAAYIQGGMKSAWRFPEEDGYFIEASQPETNIPLRPFHIPVWLQKHNTVEKLLNAKSQQEAYEAIREIRGFSSFLAYQVFVDLTYIPEFQFSENEFVVAGPGCKRGLDLIFKEYGELTSEEALFWLRDNLTEIFEELRGANARYKLEIDWNPNKLFFDLDPQDRCMNIMSLENCMCELSKYVKAVNGTGRPRQKYDGGSR